jgi:hypothetical protein
MRVWLNDRPGALGLVAGAIGAAGGDLVGIDILERDGGRAIDELTIELGEKVQIPELLKAVGALEGVEVEDLRDLRPGTFLPVNDPLEIGADILAVKSVEELYGALVAGVCLGFSAWAAVVDPTSPVVLKASEEAPSGGWLEAFVTGTRSAMREHGVASSASDVVWAMLDVADVALLAGRSGKPFRARERRQLATLARIADHRWHELVERQSMRVHPARAH